MTAICVLYVLIGIKLKRSRLLQAVPRRSYDVNRGISAQTRVIRMLGESPDRGVGGAMCKSYPKFFRLLFFSSSSSLSDAVAVAVAFFICWAPFHAQRLMAAYGSMSHSKWFNDVYSILTNISGVLYYLSTCINPLLYNIMSHKFREAFKVSCTCRWHLPCLIY